MQHKTSYNDLRILKIMNWFITLAASVLIVIVTWLPGPVLAETLHY